MSRAQLLFALALTGVTTLVVIVGTYVVSSAGWGRRWYRGGAPSAEGGDEGGRSGDAGAGG